MPAKHLDKLVKSFLSGTSNPLTPFNEFSDLQDPTYMSFKLDFFPDLGYSFPDDTYSSGGLFRPDAQGNQKDYGFYDSAATYLARIGSPARQHYLEIFTNLLWRLQEEAPWYFQSVSGLSDLWTIDPAQNFRGKDKVLTVECLESIDLRMTLLADLYRNIAFDMQNMREVLPINLRTFSMHVHVLEFRRFNTTFGVIADKLADSNRLLKGQQRQQEAIDAKRRNVFNRNASSLFTGTFDNLGGLAQGLDNKFGGIFSNLGEQAGPDPNIDLKSAFEAISVQTFVLKDCEFDFFSEAPGYLDSVSVKDSPEATFKFKIKVGKIQKTSSYSFYNYIISEYAKYSRIDPGKITTAFGRSFTSSSPYFEQTDYDSVDNPADFYRNLRESIYPTDSNSPNTAQANSYANASEESDSLRRKPLERALGGILRNASGFVNQAINQNLGELTGGILGTAPLGNIYGNPNFFRSAVEGLNNFLTPGNQLTTNQTSYTPPNEVLGNIKFESLNIDSTMTPTSKQFSPLGNPDSISQDDNVYAGTTPSNQGEINKTNIFEGVPPLPSDTNPSENVFKNTPGVSQDSASGNIYSGVPPLPSDTSPKENVFNDIPKPAQDQINNENVYE